MIKHKRKRLGVTLLLAAASTGCAGWPSTASNEPSFDTTEERLVEAQKQIDAYKGQQQAAAYNPAAGQANDSFMGSLQKAFTPEPTVNKPADPVALNNRPKEIGADVFLTAGAFYESQGQLDRAKTQYEKALATEPNQLYGLISLARLADRMGNSVEAEVKYRQAIATHPDSGLAHNDMGLFLARKGRPQEAAASLAKAASLEPANVRYLNNHATVLVELGQYDQALAQLSQTSSEAEAHYNLGYLLHRNEQNGLAVQHFQQAVQLNPQLQQAHAMLARLGRQRPTGQQPAGQQVRGFPPVQPKQHQPQPGGGEYLPYDGNPANAYTAQQNSVRQLPPVNR